MDIVFLDSCVIIDYLKGQENVFQTILSLEIPCINFIIEMELLQGARNKAELLKIEKVLNSFSLLEFNNETAVLSTNLIKEFSLSHGLKIPDAIIAATCLIYDIPLYTFNKKDFRFIPEIKLIEETVL